MRVLLAACLSAALAVPGLALAHHGWSSYDASRTLRVTAPLRNVAWRNPHGEGDLVEADVAHQERTWRVVLAPVGRMEGRGLREADLAAGQAVTVVGYPRADGTAEMRAERVITADGRTVELR